MEKKNQRIMKHEESQCDRYVASRRSFLSSKLSLSLSSTSGIAASVVSRVVDNDREWDRRGQAITRASVINRSKERLNRRQWGARWSGCVRVRGRNQPRWKNILTPRGEILVDDNSRTHGEPAQPAGPHLFAASVSFFSAAHARPPALERNFRITPTTLSRYPIPFHPPCFDHRCSSWKGTFVPC